MLVMASNSSAVFHYLAGRFPGKIAHLFTPINWRPPHHHPWMPYALDNGAYSNWDEAAFLDMCKRSLQSSMKPLWLVVPDVVGDKKATVRRWAKWAPRLKKSFGWPLAFVAQDGMSPSDVPEAADLCFIGGTPKWKERNLATFCESNLRIHVGRINTERLLWICHDLGVESVDGTGWWHREQTKDLIRYLETTAGEKARKVQLEMYG